MELPRRRFLHLAAGAAALPAASRIAQAQGYPSRPITMIVPFPAGGATDTFGRLLAERCARFLGQPVVIENVGGAAGSIGVGRAARAAPDGYTLSIGTSTTHVLIGALYALPFDLLKDFEPIALLASEPLLIVGEEEPAGGGPEGADSVAEGQSGQGVGRNRRRRRDRPCHRHRRSSRPPAPASSSCPIAATPPRCRIWSPARST